MPKQTVVVTIIVEDDEQAKHMEWRIRDAMQANVGYGEKPYVVPSYKIVIVPDREKIDASPVR